MRILSQTVALAYALCCPVPTTAEGSQTAPKAPQAAPNASPQQLFQTHCGACHSLDLPRSQRLDRGTWRWVVDDMVNQFGASWITPQQQKSIIDYLAENYGPDRPRPPAGEP